MAKQREKAFLGNLQRVDFKSIKPSWLIAEEFLIEMTDKERIKKLKEFFWLMSKHSNDKAAAEFLTLLEKAYQIKEKNIAESPDGDGHLGDARDRANRQFRDWLRDKVYWQLPDTKIAASAQFPFGDEHGSIMLQTKYWILEQIVQDWVNPEGSFGTRAGMRTSSKISKDAFDFLIAAYEPLPEDRQTLAKNAEFKTKSKGRWVSKDEKDKISDLIREYDTRFEPKELEEWMKQPWIPYEFEKTLAKARTRAGGHDLWRKDIGNAELVKPFDPDNRSEAAINFFKCCGDVIAELDHKVQKLLKQMTAGAGEWTTREKIGDSRYVLGEIKVDNYYSPLEFMLKINVEHEYSEALVCDNFERAKRHIEKWLQDNPSYKIRLSMKGGETDVNLPETLSGESHKD